MDESYSKYERLVMLLDDHVVDAQDNRTSLNTEVMAQEIMDLLEVEG